MFLSIIVPVYNTAKYLEECFDSLNQQDISEDEYEIIFVNDGSKDNSSEVLDEIKKKSENVIVVSQENGGVSKARNKGIDLAKGDYLWFVDSDDFIGVNVLEKLKTIAAEGQYERISFDYYKFENELSPEEKTEYLNGTLYKGRHYKNTNCFTSIIKRSLIEQNHVRFRNSHYGEDSMFIFECKLHIKCEYTLEETVYFYRVRPDSAMTGKNAEIQQKMYESYIYNACVFRDYYDGKYGVLESRTGSANLLMTNLNLALFHISKMPAESAKRELKRMKKIGLFPYRTPKECTDKKSYLTSRSDMIGKVFDFLYMHQSTETGFLLMRLLQKMRGLKH